MGTWRLLPALLLILNAAPALAERGCPPPRPEGNCRCHGCERVLAGHTLPVSAVLDTPLVMTWIGIRGGFELEKPGQIKIGPISTAPELLYVDDTLEMSLAWRNILAFNASVDIESALGPTQLAVVLRNAEYLVGFNAGLQARLYRSDELGLLVAARVHGGAGVGELYDLVAMVRNVAATPGATLDAILSGNAGKLAMVPLSEARAGGSVSAAKTLGRSFSIQSAVALRYYRRGLEPFQIAEQARRDVTVEVIRPEVSFAFTADAIALRVPLQLELGYQIAVPHTDDEYLGIQETHAEHLISLGIYYSGRPDLQFGAVGFLRLGLEAFPIAGVIPDGSPYLAGLSLILRTFW